MSRRLIPGLVRELKNWLAVTDYEEAKEQGTEIVISRYGRGNTCVQNGYVLDGAELKSLSTDGDAAVMRLRNDAAKHNQ